MPAELDTQPNTQPGRVRASGQAVNGVNGVNGSNCNGVNAEVRQEIVNIILLVLLFTPPVSVLQGITVHEGDRVLCVASFDKEARMCV